MNQVEEVIKIKKELEEAVNKLVSISNIKIENPFK